MSVTQRSAAPAAGKAQPSLGRNAASNLAGLFVYLLVAFFLSPFIIRSLGDVRYGAWSLVAELVGYYALFDFGLRTAVSYFVAHYAACGEDERLKSSICTAFWTLATVGAVLILAGVVMAFAFPHLFIKGQANSAEIVTAMIIMSATIGLSLPLEMFSSILTGARRLDLVNAIEVVSRLAVAAGIYLALRSGGGLVAMALVQAGGRILTWTVTYLQARRVAGPFSLRPRNVRRAELRALGGLGSMNVVINIAQIVINRTDLVVVGLFLGIKWVAYYNIGRMLVEHASSINFNLTRAFTPHLTHLHSRGETADLKRLFLLGARISGLIAMPLAACMFTFGRPFLGLWVGASYVSGPAAQRSDVVMTVLLLAHVVRWPQSISWQLIYATGRYRVLMYLNVAEALLNLGLSLVLVQWYGLIGVALGTLIPMAASNLVVIPIHVFKRFRIPPVEYLLQGIARPLAVGGALFGFTQLLAGLYYPTSWKVLFLEGGLSFLVTVLLWVSVGATREDRALARKQVHAVLRVVRPEKDPNL